MYIHINVLNIYLVDTFEQYLLIDSDLENPEEDGEEEEDEDRELDQLETIDENGNEDSGEDDAEEGEEEESGDDEEGEDEVAESEEEEEEEDKIENGDNGDAEIKETGRLSFCCQNGSLKGCYVIIWSLLYSVLCDSKSVLAYEKLEKRSLSLVDYW